MFVAFHEICGSVLFVEICGSVCFKFLVSLAKLSFELQTICAHLVRVRIVVAFLFSNQDCVRCCSQ